MDYLKKNTKSRGIVGVWSKSNSAVLQTPQQSESKSHVKSIIACKKIKLVIKSGECIEIDDSNSLDCFIYGKWMVCMSAVLFKVNVKVYIAVYCTALHGRFLLLSVVSKQSTWKLCSFIKSCRWEADRGCCRVFTFSRLLGPCSLYLHFTTKWQTFNKPSM